MFKHLMQDNTPVNIHQPMKKSHSVAVPVEFKGLISYELTNEFSVADVNSL